MLQQIRKKEAQAVIDRIQDLVDSANKETAAMDSLRSTAYWQGRVEKGLEYLVAELKAGGVLIHTKKVEGK